MAIIINFTKSASELDTEDFRMLLEDLKSRFHFNWFVQSNNSQQPLKNSKEFNTSYEGERGKSNSAITNGEMESSPALDNHNPADNIHTSIKKEVDKDYINPLDRWKNKKISKPTEVKFVSSVNSEKEGDKA